MVFCAHFDSHECRSCPLIEVPYSQQVRDKQLRVAEMLRGHVADDAWLPPVTATERGFRNRVKFVVGGHTRGVTLGITHRDGSSVDLTDCVIQDTRINAAGEKIREFLNSTALAPYVVQDRRGELKFVHVTTSPDGELMVRFVVRSEHAGRVIERRADELQRALPNVSVATVNLLPEHKAVLEGYTEWVLWGDCLPMTVDEVPLELLPKSFFQTNTVVATALYQQVTEWVSAQRPTSLWDLYCGVGGFALFASRALGTQCLVLGVEITESAVEAASRSAQKMGVPAKFQARDATAFTLASRRDSQPQSVIVNPPRRGIGAELADWLDQSNVQNVVYSSCNAQSLATDLERLPSFAIGAARLFDMFPHTAHAEVAVQLRRLSD